MATPILKIPVDSSAFEKFMALFDKFQSALKGQPDKWDDINHSIAESTDAGQKMVDSINEQVEATEQLAEAEKKREEKLQEAAKRRRDEDKEQAKRDDEAAKRRRKTIQDVRDYSKTITDVAGSVGKWFLGGGILGSIGLFGFDKLVSGVADERRLSQGMGVTSGQRQGMGATLQRYFDVNSVLGNVANMQGDPSQWGTFATMGINPNGKSVAQLTGEAAMRAAEMFRRDHGNIALANAQGLTKLFSPEDLRRLAAEDPKTLQREIQRGQRFGGFQDETGRKWQNFMSNLELAGDNLKNKLADKLSVMEPQIEALISKFGDLLGEVLDRVDFKALGDGLDTFVKYLSSQEFKDGFKNFIDDVEAIAKKIDAGLKWLGWVPDSTQPPAPTLEDKAGTVGKAVGSVVGGTMGGVVGQKQGQMIGRVIKNIEESAIGKWAAGFFGGNSNGSLADRNNNPGNIMSGPNQYNHYGSLAQGYSAMARQLMIDYDRHGQHTVYSLINDRKHGWSNEWAPGNTHQATMNYIAYVARALGVGANQEINLHDDTTIKKVMQAMHEFERGGKLKGRGGNSSHTTHVKVTNQTGTSVATTANSAAGG